MKLVDLAPEAQAISSAAREACNSLDSLSLVAGGLSGLLRLIAGNTEHLDENQKMAFDVLAAQARDVENGICAISEKLGEALDA